MVGNLKKRSLATRVYVYTSSWASTPFAERDLKTDSKVMESFENVNGSTQDLLEYVNSCDNDIFLISIGFAGLTIRSIDLVNLIDVTEVRFILTEISYPSSHKSLSNQ